MFWLIDDTTSQLQINWFEGIASTRSKMDQMNRFNFEGVVYGDSLTKSVPKSSLIRVGVIAKMMKINGG